MPIPDYESLMPSVLRLGLDLRSGKEAVQLLADEFNLTEEEKRKTIPSGPKTLLKSRLDWAVTYLVHAGLMTRPQRGHFLATDLGRKSLELHGPKINKDFLLRFPQFVEFLSRRREPVATDETVEPFPSSGLTPTELNLSSPLTPDEQIGQAHRAHRTRVA